MTISVRRRDLSLVRDRLACDLTASSLIGLQRPKPSSPKPQARQALVQRQPPHPHAQQRRRFDTGRRGAVVSRARLQLRHDHRSQLPDQRRWTERAARRRRQVPRDERRGGHRSIRDKPIHVNGFDPDVFIKPPGGSSVLDMVQNMIDAIRAARARAEHQPPQLRLGDLGRGTAPGAAHALVRGVQRPPDRQQPRRRRRARSRRGVGSDAVERQAALRHCRGRCALLQAAGRQDRAAARAGLGLRARAAARVARAGRSARARRLLFVDRRRAAVADRDAAPL